MLSKNKFHMKVALLSKRECDNENFRNIVCMKALFGGNSIKIRFHRVV